MTNKNQVDLFSYFMPKSSNTGENTKEELSTVNNPSEAQFTEKMDHQAPGVESNNELAHMQASDLDNDGNTSKEAAPKGNLFSLFKGQNAATMALRHASQGDDEGDPEYQSCDCDTEDIMSTEEKEALASENEVSDADLDVQEMAGKAGSPFQATVTKEKKPEFNRGTFIAYAGKTISITKLFTDEQLPTLEMDAVRKRLEKSYPELSKQRTNMEWDEKKNLIVPFVSKGKKGSFFIDGLKGFFFRSQDLYKYMEVVNVLAARNGYYEFRENPIGLFVNKVDEVEELEHCREGFQLALPKIPQKLFSQLISFFADYSSQYEVEVLGAFYWDSKNQEYILDIPTQRVSKSRVFPQFKQYPTHVVKVAEFHSHNTMEAYFSDIDDEDEAGTMLYGVIGELKKEEEISFQVVVRAGAARRFISLDPHTIIDSCRPQQSTYTFSPEEYPVMWHNQVEVYTQRIVGGHAL